MTDFSNYKFHCSSLKNLMVKSKIASDVLSETTKTFLREIWVKEVYGRDKSFQSISKYTLKGTMVETDSIDLVEQVTGQKYFKNNKTFENDWIIGTPDIVLPNEIKDIKSSWDIWTFMEATQKYAEKEYYYQLLGYMWLKSVEKSEILFCLVDTPEMLITDELYKLSFKVGEDHAEETRVNYIFSDIDPAKRLKAYSFEYDQQKEEELKQKISAARTYLNSLTL